MLANRAISTVDIEHTDEHTHREHLEIFSFLSRKDVRSQRGSDGMGEPEIQRERFRKIYAPIECAKSPGQYQQQTTGQFSYAPIQWSTLHKELHQPGQQRQRNIEAKFDSQR